MKSLKNIYIIAIIFSSFMSFYFIWVFRNQTISSQIENDFNHYNFSAISSGIRQISRHNSPERNEFPVDIVYTWVNGSDPLFIMDMNNYFYSSKGIKCNQKNCILSSYFYIRDNGMTANNIIASLHLKTIKNVSDTIVIFKLPDNGKKYNVVKSLENSNLGFSLRNQLVWTSESGNGRNFKINNAYIIQFTGEQLTERCLYQILGIHYVEINKYCIIQCSEKSCIVECENPVMEIWNAIRKIGNKLTFYEAYLHVFNTEDEKRSTTYTMQIFEENNELLYSLRSVEKYLSWYRKLIIVTNGQVPSWLNLTHPKIRIVTHDEIFFDRSHLPTFSCSAIEANLHRIPDLSDNFLYFNDDFLLNDYVYIQDFYTPQSGFKFYMDNDVYDCNNNCNSKLLNNGICNQNCNTYICSYDGGDCKMKINEEKLKQNEICAPMCFHELLSNNKCDQNCNTKECGFDCGNCQMYDIINVLPEIKTSIITRADNNKDFFAAWINISRYMNDSFTITPRVPFAIGIEAMSVISEGQIAVIVFNPEFQKSIIEFNLVSYGTVVNIIPILITSEAARNDDNCQDKSNFPSNMDMQFFHFNALKFVNKILNEDYGYIQREIPSHVPYFINKNIVKKMHERWPLQFEETAFNKFRTPVDMQLSFTYYNFVLSDILGTSANEVFDDFDLDQSGSWSQSEINAFEERFYITSDTHMVEFKNEIEICCRMSQCDGSMIELKREDLLNCQNLKNRLFDVKRQKRYKSISVSGKQVSHFLMVKSYEWEVKTNLNNIIRIKKKFVCFNNNLTKNRKANQAIKKLLYDYYESCFPDPSSFENHINSIT